MSIKYIGVGEKLDNLEPFYPDRMASRILGMGDVLTLIDKATSAIDLEKAKQMEQKLRTQTFDLNDFLEQLTQIKKMGSLDQILNMIPGFSSQKLKGVDLDEKDLVHVEAIISSMTFEERKNPVKLMASELLQEAALPYRVNDCLQYEQTRKM